jgi:hypothetical protein
MDAPTSACPNCGTPRGPYDRFCTGCAADLGAPGTPIGNIGTLGEMNVAGPSSRQARPAAAPAQRSVAGWVVPGTRSRLFASGAPGPASPVAQGGQLSGIGGYPAPGAASAAAYRLWRTLGIANRVIGLIWLVIILAALGSYLADRPDPTRVVGFLAVMAVFALPSLLLWISAPMLIRGEPVWLRSVVLIELAFVVVFTFGLALVPLAFIFIAAGDEP